MGSVLSPGEARAPSPSAQEILHRDGRLVPGAYLTQAGQTLLNYQEVHARLLHQTLDGYLNGQVPQDFG